MMRFLGFIFLLILVLGGVGLWQGWFNLSSSTDDTGKKSYHLEVDKDKLEQDIDRVKDKIAKVTSGAVEKIDAAAKKVTVKTDAGSLEVPLDEGTTIMLGDKTLKIGDLRPGDRLKIDWRELNGNKVAAKIEVERE